MYVYFGCPESSLLHMGFLWLWSVGASLHCGAWPSHWGGFSFGGAQTLGVQAQ